MFDALADGRESGAEDDHALVLGFVAYLAPAGMVAALLAAFASRPVAWRWPFGLGQIQTSVHAGGITSDLMRDSVSASRTGVPSGLR